MKAINKFLKGGNDLVINEVVLDKAQKKGQIIYGARAYNKQAPDYLKKKTFDYDIFTKKPKKSAKEVALELSRRLGKNVDVIKGSHKGTYRVKVDEEVVADYTQLRGKKKTKRFFGVDVLDLKTIKKGTQRIIKKPSAKYRRKKDISTLNRIKEIEMIDKKFRF